MEFKKAKCLVLWTIMIMTVLGCATTKELKYIRKDHFMAGKYEVGAIEYENEGGHGFIIKWSFPVYLNGQKMKTYHFRTHSVSEFSQHQEAQEQFDKGEEVARVQITEWSIQVEYVDGNVEVVKNYPGSLYGNYEWVKSEIINLLSH